MTLRSQSRALIVEDEYLFAMSPTVDMQALGFDTCDIAANAQDAFLQAMENPPDIVLMDVNLEGGREGIEAARLSGLCCGASALVDALFLSSSSRAGD
jgi:DNA-binding NarL/FixJ family response regulator